MRHGFSRHPLSEAWGNMTEDQLLELAEDIKHNGQKDAVVMYEGKVLDGWHRCQGCQIAGVEIRTNDFQGDNPVAYVISKNAHRRSQTASQRAAAIVRCHEWKPLHREKKVEPGSTLTATNRQMAKEANVSERTITDAKAAEDAGFGDAVVSGEMSVKEAAEQARGDEDKPKPPTLLEQAKTKIEELNSHLADRDEKILVLTDELQAYLDAGSDGNDQQTKFAQLHDQIRVLKSQVNEHMAVANQFKRECKALRKKA